MKTRTVLLLSLLLSAQVNPFPLVAQLSLSDVDALVEEALEAFSVAGAAVAVVKDGTVVLSKGYGVRSVETGERVDGHTAFAIASNSKAFTTTALAMLVEEGKLEWTDHVVDYIPEFTLYDEYVTEHFNIQDLLTHRSGLGLGAGDLQKWPSGSDFTIGDMLVNFQHFKPVSDFRTKYDYDNILYLVAGELIQRISGMPWEDFVRTRILDPLGMTHSYTLPPGQCGGDNLATPHLLREGTLHTMAPYELDPAKINGAAGGILASADDLCRWMLVHLNEGRYGEHLENVLFTEESQRQMWMIHTPIPAPRDDRYGTRISGYGLGWRIKDLNGHLCFYHSGDLSGMLSKTVLIPDLELGVVVLTNSYYGGSNLFQAVSQTIVDGYLGLDDAGWIDHQKMQSQANTNFAAEQVRSVWTQVETGNHDGIRLESYLGTYEDPWFGTVEITLDEDGGTLWFASQRSPKLTGPMHHYKANSFAIPWVQRDLDADAFAMFALDEEGRAIGFTMKGISPDIDFSYDFQDLAFRRIRKTED
ncbi:MAG: serine hydrolase [Bacteroidales bacterium]